MEKTNSPKAFLGVGWAFPPCVVTNDGSTETIAFEKDVEQAIRIILGTDQGERLMRPDFGAGLNSFVFSPINQITMQQIQTRVQEVLVKSEPRIDVKQVTVSADRTAPNKLLITIGYRVRVTNTLHNLVYPFYLQEGSAR
jgi:phage baseplate assembly protein W